MNERNVPGAPPCGHDVIRVFSGRRPSSLTHPPPLAAWPLHALSARRCMLSVTRLRARSPLLEGLGERKKSWRENQVQKVVALTYHQFHHGPCIEFAFAVSNQTRDLLLPILFYEENEIIQKASSPVRFPSPISHRDAASLAPDASLTRSADTPSLSRPCLLIPPSIAPLAAHEEDPAPFPTTASWPLRKSLSTPHRRHYRLLTHEKDLRNFSPRHHP